MYQASAPAMVANPAAAPAAVPAAGLGESLGCDVSLLMSFQGLRSKDVLSASDPFAEVQMLDSVRGKWTGVGRTSYLRNKNQGSWPEEIKVHFRFEESQKVMIRVWDFDEATAHDFLGEAVFTLGALMGSPGCKLTVKLAKRGGGQGNLGTLTVIGEKAAGGAGGSLDFQLRAQNLDNKDFMGFGRSDGYYVIERNVQGSWMSVFKSEWIKSNKNPTWKAQSISLDRLCKGNLQDQLRITVLDFDEGTKHDMIGIALVSVQQLLEAAGNPSIQFDIKHPPTKSKYKKSSYKNSGVLHVVHAKIKPSPTSRMLDYIAGGTRMNLFLAVDFTASNGDPRDPRSLHFHSPHQQNQYQSAIAAVGSILQPYDSDGMITAFGFGGVFQGHTSHCFPLNGIASNPDCHGITGVLHAYDQALANCRLSGPTFFAPLLQTVNGTIHNPEMSQQSQEYNILLILTDGAIMDMQPTIDQLVQGGDQPLSVIIVGVGSADFSAMEHLDGDDKALRDSRGRVGKRDIVQFVPFSQCQNNGQVLAKQTLAEVPKQLVQYFESRGIQPNAPLQAVANAAVVDSMAAPDALPQSLQQQTQQQPPKPPQTQQQLAATGHAVLNQAFQF